MLYDIPRAKAASASSILLFSSIIVRRSSSTTSLPLMLPLQLYPLVGSIIDHRPRFLALLYEIVPASLVTFYVILLFVSLLNTLQLSFAPAPAEFGLAQLSPGISPFLAVIPAALGIGMGPLLLVVVVPRIVERQ